MNNNNQRRVLRQFTETGCGPTATAEIADDMRQEFLRELRAATEMIGNVARRVAASPRLAEDTVNREQLEGMAGVLEQAVQDMIRDLAAPRTEAKQIADLANLMSAIEAAYMIGFRANESPVTTRLKKERPAKARQAKKKSDDEVRDIVRELAAREQAKLPGRSPNAIATNIFKRVNAQLTERNHKVFTTVRAVARRIQKERTPKA